MLSARLHSLFGHLKLIKVSRHKYQAPCPQCGGKDRFVIWDELGRERYWCSRECGFQGFADGKTTAEEIAAAIKAGKKRMEEERQRELERIRQLQDDAYWRGYRDGLNAAVRELWRQRGLPDDAIDFYELGFVEKCPHYPVSALSIPIRNQDFDVVTIQYRNTGDGPRYIDTPGIHTPPIWTMPEVKVESQPLLVTEGAIKSYVSNWELAVLGDVDLTVVGIPNASPQLAVVDSLSSLAWPRVYIATDPDTFRPEKKGNVRARDLGERFLEAGHDVRYVQLPGDIDELFKSGWKANDVMLYVNQATLDIV